VHIVVLEAGNGDDFVSRWNVDIQADAVGITGPLVKVGAFDDHSATADVIAKLLEVLDFVADESVDGFALLDLVKGDFRWD